MGGVNSCQHACFRDLLLLPSFSFRGILALSLPPRAWLAISICSNNTLLNNGRGAHSCPSLPSSASLSSLQVPVLFRRCVKRGFVFLCSLTSSFFVLIIARSKHCTLESARTRSSLSAASVLLSATLLTSQAESMPGASPLQTTSAGLLQLDSSTGSRRSLKQRWSLRFLTRPCYKSTTKPLTLGAS